jgi:hypothetical protein
MADMKKPGIVLLAGVIILALLAGCSLSRLNINFSDGVFLKLTYYPAGECPVYELFKTHAEFSSDGTVRIYCDGFREEFIDEYPEEIIQLSKDDINEIKDAVRENDILSLREDISSKSLDGDYYYLTVYTEEVEHRTGGLNVTDKSFLEVKDLACEMVEDEFNMVRALTLNIQEKGYTEMYNTD